MSGSFNFDPSMAEYTSVPKLSFSSLRSRSVNHKPAGMTTPPIQGLVSVPFMWEEAPGKPRPYLISAGIEDEIRSVVLSDKEESRCLDLPPRLFNDMIKDFSASSPTTVFDGPYVRRSRSLSLSRVSWDKLMFGSSKWRRGGHPKKTWAESDTAFDYSPFTDNSNDDTFDSSDDSSYGSAPSKMRFSRTIGRSCFISSSSKRKLWGSFVESCKQVVQWKRKH